MLEAELVWLTSDGYANLKLISRNTRFDVFSCTAQRKTTKKSSHPVYKDKEFGEEC